MRGIPASRTSWPWRSRQVVLVGSVMHLTSQPEQLAACCRFIDASREAAQVQSRPQPWHHRETNVHPPTQVAHTYLQNMTQPPASWLHEIWSQASARAHEPAIVSEEGVLTFGELIEQAACVAGFVHAQQASRVAVCLPRDLALVPRLLGVMAAGAAYVPLDPAYPQARLRTMLDQAEVDFVLTSAKLRDRLPTVAGDNVWDANDAVGAPRGPFARRANDLAYIMFTSGSTGQPKGVAVAHGGVHNFLHAMSKRPGFSHRDRLLALTSLSFDISVLELFLPLLTGGSLAIVPKHVAQSGRRIAEALDTFSPTVMQATPTTWGMLVRGGWQGHRGLKALIGGEALQPALAAELLPRVSELWNMYGPTETTVWSTCTRVHDVEAITIGIPIAATTVMVVDPHGQPVAAGESGELAIGGVGVALGYVNRLDETAQRFVTQTNANGKSERMYRTGDRVHMRSDGELVFHGRVDGQVKLRGHRIELTEIEAVLTQHQSVAQTAVVVSGEPHPQLVAHVVLREAVSPDTLRTFVATRLPEVMVPAHIEVHPELPQLPSGKVDRQTLATRAVSHTPQALLVPPLCAALCAVATEVLRQTVGPTDNFFARGGDSLLAEQLSVAVEERLGLPLSVEAIYETRSLTELAHMLEHHADPRHSTVRMVNLAGVPRPQHHVFCMGGLDLYRPLADALARRPEAACTVWGVQHPRAVQYLKGDTSWTVATLAHVCAEIRASVHQLAGDTPVTLVGFCQAGLLAYELAAQLEAEGTCVEQLTLVETALPRAVTDRPLAQWKRRARRAANLGWQRFAGSSVQPTLAPWSWGGHGVLFGLESTYTLAAAYAERQRDLRAPALFVWTTHEREHLGYDVAAAGGFSAWLHGGSREVEVPTGHREVLNDPHVEQVAQAMRNVWASSVRHAS